MAFNLAIVLVALSFSGATLAQLSGSVSTNPAGGQNVNLAATHGIGTPDRNLMGGVFAAGNTANGPVTTGAFAGLNRDGHGLSVQHANTPGFGHTLTGNAKVNLLNQGAHKLDANAFHSRTQLENGFKFTRQGGNLDYNHAAGHGATLGMSRIPQIAQNTVDLTGKANLWRSPDRMTTFDLTGSASRSFGGPFPARNNFGAGLGLTHRF